MKKINFKRLILFIATAGLLIFLHFVGWLAPVEAVAEIVLNPAAAKLQIWSSELRWQYKETFHRGDLLAEISDLKNKVEELTVANAALKKTEDENSTLREHLKFFKEGEDKKYILANIVSREVFSGPGENHGDLVIDKGRVDGIALSSVVLNERGVVVGKINKVEEKISRFTLVTNSNCKLAATLGNKSQTIGVTSGNLGLTIDMDYIPQAEEVKLGDLVVTSGLETGIPRGLVIGRVAKVNKGSNEIWQSANIDPLANFDDLLIVSVIIP
jgi:rod shape-determining protein MreC